MRIEKDGMTVEDTMDNLIETETGVTCGCANPNLRIQYRYDGLEICGCNYECNCGNSISMVCKRVVKSEKQWRQITMANRIEGENYEPKSTTACESYTEEVRQLKPCPFCGGEARAKVTIGQLDMIVTKVGCFDCEVWKYSKINSGDSIEMFNKAVQDVISKWNRRTDNEKL